MVSGTSLALSDWRAVAFADDGNLPHGRVRNTDLLRWQAVLDEVIRRGWPLTFERNGDDLPAPTAQDAFSTARDASLVFKVWPTPAVQVNLFPLDAKSIDFDFDLRELNTQSSLDALCDFVRVVGQATRGDVVLTPEGTEAAPFCVYRHASGLFELLSRR